MQWWSNGGFNGRVVDDGDGQRVWWGEIVIGATTGVLVSRSRAPTSGGQWRWCVGGRPRTVDRGVVVGRGGPCLGGANSAGRLVAQ